MGINGGMISRAAAQTAQQSASRVTTPATPSRVSADAKRVTVPAAPARVSADAQRVKTPETPRRPTGQFVSGKKHPATRHY